MAQKDSFKNVALFKELTDDEIALIASISREERFRKGTTIFKEDTEGDKFYVITSGAVKICKPVSGMKDEALAILKEGEYFGEMALMTNSPRAASAIAEEDCTLQSISKGDFNDLLFSYKDIAYKLLWLFCKTLSARLRDANQKVVQVFGR